MNDSQFLQDSATAGWNASQLIKEWERTTSQTVDDSRFMFSFGSAFGIPVSLLWEAAEWTHFGFGALTDKEFDAMLEPYLATFRDAAVVKNGE